MSEAVISIRMSEPLLSDAARQAKQTGVTLENWLLLLAAERIRDERVFERFFNREPQESDGQRMLAILDSANQATVYPGDEMES